MPKEKNKKIKKNNKIIDKDRIEQEMEEEENEELSDDIQEALGMNKAERSAKLREIDYVSELENYEEDSNDDENKIVFDADFDVDYD